MPKRRNTSTENVEAVVGRRLYIRRHESNEVNRLVDTEKDSLILLIPPQLF